MQSTTNQLLTLGRVHKIICDSLGVWSSENEELNFHIGPTEKDRRAALHQAFEEIKKEDSTYGNLESLLEATTRLAPEDTWQVKKSRTIQSYVNHFSKVDFESVNELSEFQQYIEALLTERYAKSGASELAIQFYRSAIGHYREFVREHACNAESQTESIQWFLVQELRMVLKAATQEILPCDTWPDYSLSEQWPLKVFAEAACQVTGISLHKLHQYHQFQMDGPPIEDAWARDFAGQQVNTRSKQVADRLRKHGRMKWETFYPTFQPLTFYLPIPLSDKAFVNHAFSAMIAHNLNDNAPTSDSVVPTARVQVLSMPVAFIPSIPSSELMEFQINGYELRDDIAKQAPSSYRALLDRIRNLPGTLKIAVDIPGGIDIVYNNAHRQFNAENLNLTAEDAPSWINKWRCANSSMQAGDSKLALMHFKDALEQAKYVAGPLFVSFYIQACAFCKFQYRSLAERDEVDLFEPELEAFGKSVTNYAGLMGYTSRYIRDPKTLLPHSMFPTKAKWFIREIDDFSEKLRY
jgi:hypothetical protein